MSKNFTSVNIDELPGCEIYAYPVLDRDMWQETNRNYLPGNIDPVEINATHVPTGEKYLFDRERLGHKVSLAPHKFAQWQAWKVE